MCPPQASTGCATPAPSAPPSGAPPPAPAPRGAVTTSSSQRVIDFIKIVFIFFRFGVCCAFSGGCGSVATYNNTYFSSGTAPASPCQMRVCRAGTEVSAATPRVATCDHVPAAGVPAQTQLRHVRDRAAQHQRARGHGPQQQGQLHTG